jgi:hypothetical protein
VGVIVYSFSPPPEAAKAKAAPDLPSCPTLKRRLCFDDLPLWLTAKHRKGHDCFLSLAPLIVLFHDVPSIGGITCAKIINEQRKEISEGKCRIIDGFLYCIKCTRVRGF